ncbi:hypothetical protein ACGFMM_24175 [Streptomyces sp. NPDC048604]|uniref:hypothetical protein n=1 Tax=Streptomyces sp. NPDC048604 TaxID=3365578 RepID=UPI00371D5F4C
MTEQRPFDDEHVRQLLTAAADLPGHPAATPGADFVARARRSLVRRRLGAAVGALAVCIAAAVAVPAVIQGMSDPERALAAADGPCVQRAAQQLKGEQQRGFRAVFGVLRPEAVAMRDGITEGSAFRFDIEGALADGAGAPSSGRALVWYPVSETQLPRPGRYVLVLQEAERPSDGGERLYEFVPDRVLPLTADGSVELSCGEGRAGAVDLERLRSAVNGPASAG